MALVDLVIAGLETGSFIAVAAIGITLVYGFTDMINFAHAEFMVIGAYVGVLSVNALGLPLIGALVLVPLVSAAAGWAVARTFFMPIREAGPIPLLVTSIGVGLLLRFGIQITASPAPRYLDLDLVSETVTVGGVTMASYTPLVIGIAAASFVLLHLLLTRTTLGTALRAMGANEDLALVTGIDTDRLRHIIWLISAAMGGLAGFLLTFPLFAIPSLGFQQIIIVISAAILGGAGSVYGAIAGAYVLGLTIAISTGMLLPAWGTNLGTTVAFVVLFLVLLVRPGGIAGAEVTKMREVA